MSPGTDHLAERILVLAPTGRDAPLICTVLRQANLFAQRCGDIAELCAALEGGAAAVLITEEALDPASLKKLIEALERQPSWSDIPILLLTGREFAESSVRPLRFLGPLRNVTLLERPIRLLILISAVRVALRARKRQYELRDYLEEREKTAVERTAMLQREHEAREAAEAANRMKDEFLATVSHELRTPLNAILGWTSILKTERYDPAKAGRALDIVERNARAQVQLIEDLLDLSRVVTGKLRLEPKPLHVVPLVEAAVETIRPAAAAKGIVLEMKSAPEIEEILGDGDRLHQVIWNLLSNAVKFTPEGGRVRVDVERLETQIEIQVGDTGVGISPEFLPHIFERFRQADSAPTRAHGGLGLGLAIVRHLVELHGGIVEAASPGKGLGSRFTVRLPVRPVGPVDAATMGRAAPAARAPRRSPHFGRRR
jgi:signal transduction histidine kinase